MPQLVELEEQLDKESCQTLLCPRWVLLLFVKEFWGRARPGVNDETLGTSNGGGSLQDGQHHGGGDELFSSEVISSLKEVGWKKALVEGVLERG